MPTPNDYLLAKCAARAFIGKRLADPTKEYPKTDEEAGVALAALARAMWDAACAREQRGWRWALNKTRQIWQLVLLYATTTARERETVVKFSLRHCRTDEGRAFSEFCPLCKPTVLGRIERWWRGRSTVVKPP